MGFRSVHIYRNPLMKGPRYEQHTIGQQRTTPHNEAARIRLLNQFLNDASEGSSLHQHKRSIEWLCAIYRALHNNISGGSEILQWTPSIS